MSWSVRLAGFAGAVLLGLASAAAAVAAPAMWRVSDGDTQVYLFGSLHALKPGAPWRTPLYDAVFARASTVWFEADLQSGDPDTVRLLIQRYGADPDTPLSHKLAPDDLGALSRQTDVARLEHLRPWAAALMLTMQPALAKGASVEKGVDMTATREARSDAKRVRAFETLEDQARMYASLPAGAELRYLADVIHDRRPHLKLPFQPAGLEQAWLSGRLGAREIEAMRAENPALYEALVRRRNLSWADKLSAELAATPGVELVDVGALHMLGPDGLPALLAARGYTVERVQ